MPKKYYAVRAGRKPGIYNNWPECKAQVCGYSGSVFKGFRTEQEAQEYLNASRHQVQEQREADVLIYTDGSFDVRTGAAGYAAVFVQGGVVIGSMSGPCTKENKYRNVSPEIEAVERALMLALERGFKVIDICHDYLGISEWATGGWKAKTSVTQAYVEFMREVMGKVNIRFVKVKAHSGDAFNEMADTQAAAGASRSRCQTIFALEAASDPGPETGSRNALPDISPAEIPRKKRAVYRCPHCEKRVAKSSAECRHCRKQLAAQTIQSA